MLTTMWYFGYADLCFLLAPKRKETLPFEREEDSEWCFWYMYRLLEYTLLAFRFGGRILEFIKNSP